MTLYNYTVTFNPISNWIAARSYFVGNKVKEGVAFYSCKLDHLSVDPTNKPPNATFWDVITPISPNQDITTFCETVKPTEIGSGEIRSLELRLNADRGGFITQTNGGLTPIIDEFDKIQVEATDSRGRPFFAIYEVNNTKPQEDGLQGTVLPVELLGPEFHLNRTHFAEQFFFKSGFTVTSGIIDFYNKNKGTLQPHVINHTAKSPTGFNDLAQFTANDYLFNLAPTTHYDGLIYTMDRDGSSVAARGAGDFFEIMFDSDSTNADQIKFRGFSSGNPSDQTSIPNIISTTAVNPAEEEGGIESTMGTVVATWGADGIGTLPRQNSDFIGALESWILFPTHIPGELYPKDAIILVLNTAPDSQGDDFHYKALQNTTENPPVPPDITPTANWKNYIFTDYLSTEVGTAAQYSFWTNARANPWKSSGANTSGNLLEDPPTFFSLSPITVGSMAVYDSNQVVQDGKFKRVDADVRAITFAQIPAQFKRNGKVYRGFRVLVDTILGTPVAPFDAFADKITMWDGDEWILFRLGNTNVDGSMVAIDKEALIYQYKIESNIAGLSEWNIIIPFLFGTRVKRLNVAYECRVALSIGSQPPSADWYTLPGYFDISGDLKQGNECYHPVFNITNTQGSNDKNNGAGGNVGEFSAITHEFRYENNDILDAVRDEPQYYRIHAGATFRIPFPFNSFNTNSIGSIYGNNNDTLEPATIEAYNMNLTASGLSGFNNIEAQDLGPLDALTMHALFDWRFNKDGTGRLVRKGNFPMRCAMQDIDGAVVIQDFTIPINGLWERNIRLPLGSFKAYEARVPLSFGDAAQNIFLQQIEILEKFRFRNIRKISFQWLGPYDDDGRYAPFTQKGEVYPDFIDFLTNEAVSGFNIKFSIDVLQFSKPLLSVSPPVIIGRSLQPAFFEEPLITNQIQNDQANFAKLEIMQFRHKEFEITTEMRFDIPFGASYFLENKHLVSNSDRTTTDLDAWVTVTNYIIDDDVQDLNVGYRCVQNNTSSGTNKPPNVTFWSVLTNPIPNTIKLVNKKTIHGIDKVPTGPGGALSTFTGVKRFE